MKDSEGQFHKRKIVVIGLYTGRHTIPDVRHYIGYLFWFVCPLVTLLDLAFPPPSLKMYILLKYSCYSVSGTQQGDLVIQIHAYYF